MIFEIALGVLLAYIIYLRLTREVIIDADGSPYLIRYFLFKSRKFGRLLLHHIVRSDYDRALHSHPWAFKSFILWGGYFEIADSRQLETFQEGWKRYRELQRIKWWKPLSLLSNKDYWIHRIVLPKGKTAWTIVRNYPKSKEWGFWITPYDFCHHKNYSTKTGLCEV